MKRERRAFISFVLAFSGLFLFSTSSAQETDSLRTSIIDGIQSNLDAVKSLEAHVTEKSLQPVMIDRKVRLVSRNSEKVVWFSAPKCRQQLKTQMPGRNGQMAPYTSDVLFDGQNTRQLINSRAILQKGNVLGPAQDLGVGYRFEGWILPQSLRYATKIEPDDESNGGNQRHLIKVTMVGPGRSNYTSTLWLDRDAGFVIVRASRADAEGRPVSERRNTTLTKQGGAWFVTHGEDEAWKYDDDDQRQTTGSRVWDVTLQSVNQPIPASALNLTYPAGTVVTDLSVPRRTAARPDKLPDIVMVAQYRRPHRQAKILAGVAGGVLLVIAAGSIAAVWRKRIRN